MKKGGRLSKNVIDMTDTGPNGKKAKSAKRSMLPTLNGIMPTSSENRKAIAGRAKLKETEKIVLGGMDKAKNEDRVKVAEMAAKRSADLLKQMQDMTKKPVGKAPTGKLPQGLPKKTPVPTARPKAPTPNPRRKK